MGLGPGVPTSPGGSAISPAQPATSVAATKIALFQALALFQVYIALTSQVLVVRAKGSAVEAWSFFTNHAPWGPCPALRSFLYISTRVSRDLETQLSVQLSGS